MQDTSTKNEKINGSGLTFALVVSKYHTDITRKLHDSTIQTLVDHEVSPEDIDVFWVPGSWEIPLQAKKLSASKKYKAVISIGLVLRGQTPHFDYICQGVTSGLTQVALETGVPNIFGVLTCDNMEQVLDRVGGKHGDKGEEAALAALQMAQSS